MEKKQQNPFANIWLAAPAAQEEHYNLYCQTQRTGKASVKRAPFRRKVDLWFAGLSLAARQRLKPLRLRRNETTSFITGDIFSGDDEWRVSMVMLVAIAVEGDVEVVMEPRRMMDIANGLAAAGVPHIVEMLNNGDQDPIFNLSDALEELLGDEKLQEADSDYDRDRIAKVL